MDRLIDLDLESLKLGLLSSDRFFQKRLIIFNSASFCGFTEQLHEFEKIYQEGHIVPIAIPTNEFGKQEPGDNYEILQYYRTKFNITFPVAKKLSSIIIFSLNLENLIGISINGFLIKIINS
jgi:glutathione peroxidase